MPLVAIVGGNGTLGQALVNAFVSHSPVVVSYRTRPLACSDQRIAGIPLNLSSKESVCAFARALKGEAITALVVTAGENEDALILKESPERFARAIESFITHLNALLTALKDNLQNAHIALIGSIVGVQGNAGQAAYSAVKGAMIGLMYERAKEFAAMNAKINVVLPGLFRSPMTRALSEKAYTARVQENVLNRPQETEEIAAFVRHLTQMNNVSAQVFNIDSRALPPF